MLFCSAVFTAMIALEQLRMNIRVTAPVIGVLLCWAGCVDVLYPLIADPHLVSESVLQTPEPELPAHAAAYRDLCPDGVPYHQPRKLLLAGLALVVGRAAGENRQSKLLMAGLGGAAAVGFAAWLVRTGAGPIPPAITAFNPEEALLQRPWELLPTALFVFIAVTVAPAYDRARRTHFARALWLSCIPEIAAHLLMAFGSKALFDRPFLTAHLLVTVAYGVRLGGLLLDHSQTYVRLQHMHDRLKEEMAELQVAELARRAAEAVASSLADSLPIGIFRKDLEGRFTFVNERFCRGLNLTPEQVLGKTDADLFPADLVTKYRADDARVIEHNAPIEAQEEFREGPDAPTSHVHTLKSPVHDAAGKIIGVQGMFWNPADLGSKS